MYPGSSAHLLETNRNLVWNKLGHLSYPKDGTILSINTLGNTTIKSNIKSRFTTNITKWLSGNWFHSQSEKTNKNAFFDISHDVRSKVYMKEIRCDSIGNSQIEVRFQSFMCAEYFMRHVLLLLTAVFKEIRHWWAVSSHAHIGRHGAAPTVQWSTQYIFGAIRY